MSLVFEKLSTIFFQFLNLFFDGKLISYLSELLHPVYYVRKGSFSGKFCTPNRLTHWRAQTLLTKEPETIEWIDSFGEDDIFFDIGANVGVYTIYAGRKFDRLKIFSFEPVYSNYKILNENIYINGLAGRVSALSIALSNENKLDYIYMPKIEDGGALVNFGDNVDFNKEKFDVEFKQAVTGYRLDDYIKQFKLPTPNHIKIDVDGLESKIIEGAELTLQNSSLKSLSIELNDDLEADKLLRDKIESCGLRYKHKKRAAYLDGTDYDNIYNYIFVREDSL